MEETKPGSSVNDFNKFVTEMLDQYNLSHEEIMKAVSFFGESRSKLWAYCAVQHSLRNKGLPIEDAKHSIINRWFP